MKLRSSRSNLVLLTDDTLQGTLLAKLKLVLGGLTQSQSGHFMQRKMESELEVTSVSSLTPNHNL